MRRLPLLLVLALAAAGLPGSAGAGESGCGPPPPKVRLDWEKLDLVRGERVLTVEERIALDSPRFDTGNLPTVVRLCDYREEAAVRTYWNVLSDLGTRILLTRFRLRRVVVDDLPAGAVKSAYQAIGNAYLFLDPWGREAARVTGRGCSSLASFGDALRRTWDASFSMSRSEFTKTMRRIVGREGRHRQRAKLLRRRQLFLPERPGKTELLRNAAEEAELETEKAAIAAAKQDLRDRCRLRPVWLQPTKPAARGPLLR